MAEENHQSHHLADVPVVREEQSAPVEAKDRGLFDFMAKKKNDEPPQEEVIVAEFEEKVNICETEDPKLDGEEVKHSSLLEKLHRSDSNSSSSVSSHPLCI